MAQYAIRDWLRSVLYPAYIHIDKVIEQVEPVLLAYPGLAPKMDTLVRDNGQTSLLLCLHGTIPVAFRNSTYNIPIKIWLPTDFPLVSGPLAYVTPTANMVIKPSQHVDTSGQIWHPYLTDWWRNVHTARLYDCINILKGIFSNEPPVYAKSSSSSNNQVQSPASPPKPSTTPTSNNNNNNNNTNTHRINLLDNKYHPDDPAIMRQSLVSAVKDKIRRQVQDFNATMTEKVDRLLRDNKSLVESQVKLNETLRIHSVTLSRIKGNLEILKSKNAALEQELVTLRALPEPDVDKDLSATNVAFQQLYDLVAEEHAIEDTIYYLSKALIAEKLDLVTFMKHVRSLAKDQFLKRALIKKIRAHAKLVDV